MKRKSLEECFSLTYSPSMYHHKPFYATVKRITDLLVSFTGIVLLSWLFLIIAILVKCTSKGPVFYGHERVGRHGKMFKVLKFRSMRNDPRPLEEIFTPEQMEEYKREYKVADDPRVTKVGKFLRKTSLDELPQLFNVLIGNMSLVGWRPILPEEFEKYGENKELLGKAKPGITGYWASHGRSDIEYEDRIKMELYYVYKRSLWLDFRILWHTFFGVLGRKGAE